MNRLSLSLCFLSTLFVSCSGRDGLEESKPEVVKATYGTPIMLGLDDPLCQDNPGTGVRLNSLNFYIFKNDTEIESLSHDVTEYDGDFYLSGGVIKKSTFNQEEAYDILNQSVEVVKDKKGFQVCHSSHTPEEKSLENVLYSSVYAIDIANKSYERVTGKTLKKVTLNIHPIDLRFIKGERDGKMYDVKQYFTDNATYDLEKNEITLYPQSKEAVERDIFGGKPLWQVPFVTSHEFGHHVINTLFPSSLRSYKLFLRRNAGKHLIVKHQDKLQDHLKPNKSSNNENKPISALKVAKVTRTVDSGTSISALHEAVADMYAAYTLGLDNQNLGGLKCFAGREITKNYFVNLDEKKLGESQLSTYFSTSEAERSSEACAPDYQDNHAIGAIIAYGMNKVFEISSLDNDEKLKLIVKWMEKLEMDYSSDSHKSARSYLKEIIRDGLLVATTNADKSKLSSAQCEIVKKVFPAFYEDYSSSICD